MLKKIKKIGVWLLITLLITPIIWYLLFYPYGFWGLFMYTFLLSSIAYFFYKLLSDDINLILLYLSNNIIQHISLCLNIWQSIYEVLSYIYGSYDYIKFFKYFLIFLVCSYILFV
jgi:hypothetical protein